ncbi:MAG: D-aminoacylase [Gammaproteobacteria bacterium]|nr:D-aminoacylase [Gammaproteobacteria bacterium]MDH4315995.1 D-aminoacylase [Gammaproteobacteria bacterium]MDH5214868.1 D-aminoacylase [Gammaproteobacteria bacterium]MDH5499903.1 D-aminoacylase [Gammaproteobacteria bacterium]
MSILRTTLILLAATAANATDYDVLVLNGTIYDGTGAPPYVADLAISGDRLSAIGTFADKSADLVIDAGGLAVAPGFFNMLSHAHVSLITDGRAMSDVLQGVTFEVLSEASLSPLSDASAEMWEALFADEDVALSWRTVADYLQVVEASGVSPNFATFVSAATVRVNFLGMDDVDPTPDQLELMKAQVEQAMKDGALGLTDALIYAPGAYAETEEIIELAKVAGRYGGIYTAHMRSEGNQFIEAIDETLRIGREGKLPVKIHHLKAAGQPNWEKMDIAINKINALRDEGIPITADMYTYVAGATGLDASMPTWVQAGGYDKWAERLKDPEIRARVKAEMAINAEDWENIGYLAGPDGMMLLGFKNDELRKYKGMTLTEVAKERGQDYRDTIIDLVIEDGSRVGTVYFLMSEENLKKQIRQPWVMFGSDADAPAAEGEALEGGAHPRTYGNVARLLSKYVREEQVITLQEAVRRLTLLPAETLGIGTRGRLAPGYFADVAIFDPESVADKATFDDPHQYSIGMVHVLVNGVPVVSEGMHTGATPGRAVRGPGWKP